MDFGNHILHPRIEPQQHVGAVTTEKSKNSIPLDDDLLDELLAWRQETPYAENSDYMFASPKMKGKQPYWMSRIMQHHIKPAASEAGIEIKGWHTLRHYAPFCGKTGRTSKSCRNCSGTPPAGSRWTHIHKQSRHKNAKRRVE
jgi:integrase